MECTFRSRPLLYGLMISAIYYSVIVVFVDYLFFDVADRDVDIYITLLVVHLIYVFFLALPYIIYKNNYNYLCISVPKTRIYLCLFLGGCVSLFYFSSTVGIAKWLIYPRWSYEVTRVGKIWLWSLSITLISFPLFFIVLLESKIYKRLLLFCISSALLYFFGSKQLIITFAFFIGIFELSRVKVSYVFIFSIFLFSTSFGIYILATSFKNFNMTVALSYFDYVNNGYIAMSQDIPRLEYLDVFLSEFWSLVPRGLGFDKPDVVGQSMVNAAIDLGNPAAGYTPAILRSSVMYIDAGLLFPFFYFLFDLRYLFVFISVYVLFSCKVENVKLVSFSFVILCMPNFFIFYPSMYSVVGAFVFAKLLAIKIIKYD